MSRHIVSSHGAGVAATDRGTWIVFGLMLLLAGGSAAMVRDLRENS